MAAAFRQLAVAAAFRQLAVAAAFRLPAPSLQPRETGIVSRTTGHSASILSES
ncbi:hypothetical protein ACWEPB_15355 [Kitasatospora cineracea]